MHTMGIRFNTYLLATAVIMTCLACSKTKLGKADIIPGHVDPAEYQLYDYYIDEYGNEGVVGALNLNPDNFINYIIVISADETETNWGRADMEVYRWADQYASRYGYTMGKQFNGEYTGGVFFGLEMNRLVHAQGQEGFPAFDWCLSKNKGERYVHSGSWMLPSYNEFTHMTYGDKLEKLNEALISMGGTPISEEDYYWSCVEDIENAFHFSDTTLTYAKDYDQKRRAVPFLAGRLFPSDKTYWHKQYNFYKVRAIKYIYVSSMTEEEYNDAY